MRDGKVQTRGRPRSGTALTAAERMRRLRARRKTAGLKQTTIWSSSGGLTPDGHFPRQLLRTDEQRLHELVRSGDLTPARWRAEAPAFFMAGLAVLIAGVRGFDRDPLLHLANTLHPGILEVPVYGMWLAQTPLEPSRFLSQLLSAIDEAQ